MSSKSSAMCGGDGLHSYFHNSSFQKAGAQTASKIIKEVINNIFDFDNNNNMAQNSCPNSNIIRIADFGCSTGPNTFYTMQNVVESISLKYHNKKNLPPLEFHVFFNDKTDNDFNTLFRNLPSPPKFFSAGVAGSFSTGRLFPSSSLHFGNSTYALHWLSQVPNTNAMTSMNSKSHAINGKESKRCIGFENEEVVHAFSAQFKEDMGEFLNARALEIAGGGLMVILIAGVPDDVLLSQTCLGIAYHSLLNCLFDLAKLGMLREEEVENFTLPVHHPKMKELEEAIEKNSFFSIERMETLPCPSNVRVGASMLRGIFEEVIKDHFGSQVVDLVFHNLNQKLISLNFEALYEGYPQHVDLLVVLKRNHE